LRKPFVLTTADEHVRTATTARQMREYARLAVARGHAMIERAQTMRPTRRRPTTRVRQQTWNSLRHRRANRPHPFRHAQRATASSVWKKRNRQEVQRAGLCVPAAAHGTRSRRNA